MHIRAGSLQVTDARESDEGKYECSAENTVGIKYLFPVNPYVRGISDSFWICAAVYGRIAISVIAVEGSVEGSVLDQIFT